MKRLTYKEPNGDFGVVGMNEQNQDSKLYACVTKLTHYENVGLTPDEVKVLIYTNAALMKEINKLKEQTCQFMKA